MNEINYNKYAILATSRANVKNILFGYKPEYHNLLKHAWMPLPVGEVLSTNHERMNLPPALCRVGDEN